MPTTETRPSVESPPCSPDPDTVGKVRRYYRSREHQRRGICLLNAGRYHEAAAQFNESSRLNPGSATLPYYIAECHVHRGAYAAAAEQMGRLLERDGEDVTARIRRAMLLWKDGSPQGAVESLRQSIQAVPDVAELHFQLGTLLAATGGREEAELRFTQAIALDGRHADALVALALCLAEHYEPVQAVRHLRRAQELRPHDARIGLYLTMAMQAAEGTGASMRVMAQMPPDEDPSDDRAVATLSLIVEEDPEFVDALISLPREEVDEGLFRLLLQTIQIALRRRPDQAGLHYQCGRILDRLGEAADAIGSAEQAVAIKPRYVQALILLAKLYQKTNRRRDATDRLEETLRLGVRYADVYLMLGNLYRDGGESDRARDAYRNSLAINGDYREARSALAELTSEG